VGQYIDNGNDIRVLVEILLLLSGYECPEFLDVDSRSPVDVAGKVEVTHTDLSEVTWMVLVEVGAAWARFKGMQGGKQGGKNASKTLREM
jgi:hypothetical protein